MNILEKFEHQIFEAVQDKLKIETEFVEDEDGTLFIRTVSRFGEMEVYEYDMDLTPLIEIIEERIQK